MDWIGELAQYSCRIELRSLLGTRAVFLKRIDLIVFPHWSPGVGVGGGGVAGGVTGVRSQWPNTGRAGGRRAEKPCTTTLTLVVYGNGYLYPYACLLRFHYISLSNGYLYLYASILRFHDIALVVYRNGYLHVYACLLTFHYISPSSIWKWLFVSLCLHSKVPLH